MPIYEYECPNCGARFEELQKMSDCNQSIQCKTCGSTAVRILSSPNILSCANNTPNDNQMSSEPVMGGSQITDCTFENLDTGISLPEGANVTLKGNKFKNVKIPVKFRKK